VRIVGHLPWTGQRPAPTRIVPAEQRVAVRKWAADREVLIRAWRRAARIGYLPVFSVNLFLRQTPTVFLPPCWPAKCDLASTEGSPKTVGQ